MIGGIDGADIDVEADIALFEPEVDFSEPGIDADVEVFDSQQSEKSEQDTTPRRPPFNPLLVLKTIKFWTFGLCFFGLTGLLFSWFAPHLGPVIILAIALVMGLLIGGATASALQILRYRSANSMIAPGELVGQLGTVEIPFDQNSRGKGRLYFGDNVHEMMARTSDSQAFQAGDRVVVVGREDNQLWVVSEESLKKT